jgi:hypothetical protein
MSVIFILLTYAAMAAGFVFLGLFLMALFAWFDDPDDLV